MKNLLFRHSLNLFFFFSTVAVGCVPVFDIPRGYNVTDKPLIFKVSMDRPATKALEITTANISSFEATAYPANTTSSAYFSANTFTGSGSPKVFSAAGDLSWPDVALDFYAWSAGSGSSQVSKTAYNTFTVTPSTSPSSQVDLVFACAKNQSLSSVTDGVLPLNFRHTGSRIAVKVKNTGSKYRFVVSAWKVGYLDNSATFVHDGSSTASSGTLPASCWTDNTSPSVSNSYQYTLSSSVNVPATAATVVNLDGDMIVIPQSVTKATAYQSTSAGALPNGSYVAIKVKIIDNVTERVIFSDESGNPAWAIWPVAFDWSPGQKYTYSVDLSKGAYYETNPAAGSSALFAFDNEFVGISVTVGDFNVQDVIRLPATTIAGLMIADAQLYYDGTNYIIKDKDWKHLSYGSAYGQSAGSYYFRISNVSNIGSTIQVSYRNYNDWRLPTSDEMSAIIGTTRPGSTVNGRANSHYALTYSENIIDAYTGYGLLLFPDNEIINGAELGTNIDNINTLASLSDEQLNDYLAQGCVFLPATGYYDSSNNRYWESGGRYKGYYLTSTTYSTGSWSKNYYTYCGYFRNLIPAGGSGGSLSVSSTSRDDVYIPVRLVRTAN